MNENKELISEYARALNGQPKDPSLVARFVADPKLRQHIAAFEAAFPNYGFTMEDLIAEGSLVVLRAIFHGTHRGAFGDIPPTGRKISISAIIIYRIAEGRIVEHWMEWDPMALVKQLTEEPSYEQHREMGA